MVGLISYFLLALAAVFALIPKTAFRIMRTVLMIAGLFINFAVRLTNAGAVFGRLDFSKTPSVLNGAVYVFSQLAVLLLLAYYLVLRHNKKRDRALRCLFCHRVRIADEVPHEH